MRRLAIAVAAIVVLALPAGSTPATRITVDAAASLTGVFPRIDKAPRYSFAGSDTLAAQIAQGAPVDVFASASPKQAELLHHNGVLRRPVVFATNKLVVIVPSSNPARIRSVYDLRRRGIKVIVGTPTVPVGAYTRQILDSLGITQAVMGNVVDQEPDVKGIVAKIALGEGDAGFVYKTDARPAGSKVTTVLIPGWAQPPIRYEIGIVRKSSHRAAAAAFIARVTSLRGRRLLVAAGFGLPKRPRR
ncbi:MAG TPA: molybdate ABC transporter substrate-binding protein [Gaiellaceae bacterium]|nr:molybdate ABC transporter substrate-binding protein [Gaiellaceae bacterium]